MATERIVIIVTENGSETVIKKIDGIGKTARTSSDSINFLQKALGLIGAAATLKGLTELLDSYQNIANRLNVVSKSTDEAAAAQERLFEVANRSRTSFEATAELYARVVQSTVQLGTSHEQAARIVETLNKAVIVSGASSREAEAALLQLSQGLASGTLRGQELRSVLTQMPVVADLISQRLGITRGALRTFGAEGKITSKIMIESLIGAADEIDAKFAKTSPTLSQGFAVLQNQLLQFVGQLNEKFQIIPRVSGFLTALGNNMDTIARVVIAGSFVLGVTKAIGVVNALTLALATNPLGAIALAVTAAVAALITFSDQMSLTTGSAAKLSDVFSVVFKDIQDDLKFLLTYIGENFGFVSEFLRNIFGKDFEFSIKGFLKLGAKAVDAYVGLFLGLGTAVRAVFNNLGAAVEIIFKGMINGLIALFEGLINGIIKGYNKIAQTNIGLNLGLKPELAVFKLDRVKLSTEAVDLGKAVGDGFKNGLAYDGTEKYLDGVLQKSEDRAKVRLQEAQAKQKALEAGRSQLNEPVVGDKSLKDERVVAIEEVIKKLKEEGEALKQNTFERDIANKYIQIEQTLKHKGIELGKEEAAQITDQLRANELLKVRAQLIDQVDGALENNAREQKVANDLIREGTGRTDLYVAKLRSLKIAQLEMERDTGSGFERGFLKVQDEITNFADASEKVVTNAFHNMEDALVSFVTKGKLDFAGLVDSILADLTRLLLRQAISGLLSSFGGGGGILGSLFGGARAEGGPVTPGKAYLVGERGPEIFHPDSAGAIVPNGAGGGAAPQVHVSVVNVADPDEVSRALNNPKNHQQILNILRTNKQAAKTALGLPG